MYKIQLLDHKARDRYYNLLVKNNDISYNIYFKTTICNSIVSDNLYDIFLENKQYIGKETNLPEHLNNMDFYKVLCSYMGELLYFVPNAILNQDLCNIAFDNNYMVIKFLKEEFKTEDLCKRAVANNWICLQYVPKHLRSKELCYLAFNQNVRALRYFPNEYKTYDICFKSVIYNMETINFVPDDYLIDIYNNCVLNIGKTFPTNYPGTAVYRNVYNRIERLLSLSGQQIKKTNSDDTEKLKQILEEERQLLLRWKQLQEEKKRLIKK